jgi:hypothetical protein
MLTMQHPSIRKKLAVTSPASSSHSVSIALSRTKATGLLLLVISLELKVQLLPIQSFVNKGRHQNTTDYRNCFQDCVFQFTDYLYYCPLGYGITLSGY